MPKLSKRTNSSRESDPLLQRNDFIDNSSESIGLVEYRTMTNSPSSSQSQSPSLNATTQIEQSENHRSNEDSDEKELNLKYGAEQIMEIIVPVVICLFFVTTSVNLISSYQKTDGTTLLYTPFDESSQTDGTKLWMSIANASIFISVVVVMTVVLVVLYKYKFYRLIHGWLAFSSLMLLFFFNYLYLGELLKEFNVVVDMLTVTFLLWNFGVVGMFCIHWKGPLVLQQAFLIYVCMQIALRFIKYLPEWTTWVILAFLSIWDLIAVLCPFGPLRILVETAHSRKDNLFPAMVYSSTYIFTMMASPVNSNESAENHNNELAASQDDTSQNSELLNIQDGEPNQLETSQRNVEEQPNAANQNEEENGVKLGLGDFIFYSILVGKASILGDWNTVIACFLAILVGLLFTTTLLAIYHKPLPALPISLIFGLVFYFLTNLIVRPFYDNLTYKQFFI